MKKAITAILIFIVIAFLIMVSPMLLFSILLSFETPEKASGLINGLKPRIPEIKTFFEENRENFNALEEFQKETGKQRYTFRLREEMEVSISEFNEAMSASYNSSTFTLEEASLTDAFKETITELCQGIDGDGYIDIGGNNISIMYATSEKDSRATVFIKDIDKHIDTVDEKTLYLKMLDEGWFLEIFYHPRS